MEGRGKMRRIRYLRGGEERVWGADEQRLGGGDRDNEMERETCQ